MPSILFINRVYPPAEGATGRVLEHVAEGFARADWEVSVLTTACPSQPAGTSFRHGVKIIRIGLPFSKRSILSRALGYALMIPALGLRALLLLRAEVVVIKTDPPMLLVLGPLLRMVKGSRLIHWAQDLYPEVAEEVGIFRKGGILASTLRGISTRAMRSYDRIVAVGRCMREKLVARGIPSERICVIPNIGIEQEIRPVEPLINGFRQRHGLGDCFVVEYSGNMGRAHEFETLLSVAQKLQECGESKIRFLLIGGGPGEVMLRDEVQRRGLMNVLFLPSQPQSELSESLGAGDLHLVTMKKGMSGLVVPSKFYGVMAAGRPCLFIGPADAEVARVIREQDVGAVIAPGDGEGLLAAILAYRDTPEMLAEAGRKALHLLLEEDSIELFVVTASELPTP
jgi:colanic acid biosynthesis glycosyl transferase WcaI